MDKKKKQLKTKARLSIIAGLAAACLCMTTLVSCGDTSSLEPQTSEAQTSDAALTSDVLDTSSAPPASTFEEEQIAAGKIYTSRSDTAEGQAEYITKWYCENILKQDFADCIDYFAALQGITSFEDLYLEYAVYGLKQDNNTENKYLYILFVNEYNNKKNVLVDGLMTSEIIPYPIDRIKEKISKHALYGKYAKYLTEPVYTEGMYELDIASLIGKNRQVHWNTFINEHVVAVLSSKVDYMEQYQWDYSEWKIDFIDLATGQRIKEHKFQDFGERFSICNTVVNDEFIYVMFYSRTLDDTEDVVKYSIKLNDNTIKTERYTLEEFEKNVMRSDERIMSDSGRYYAFYKDNGYDLYLHDNQTGKDILLYDGYFDDEYGKNLVLPAVSFFIGDTLFFNIYGYEHFIGSGMYDPHTNKLSVFNNNINTEFYSNGYIYGYMYGDSNLYRFSIDAPDKVENTFPDFYQTSISYAPSLKYLLNISSRLGETDILTLYEIDGLKEITTYTFSSPFIRLNYGIMSDSYIYLPSSQNNVVDNKAYIIKLN